MHINFCLLPFTLYLAVFSYKLTTVYIGLVVFCSEYDSIDEARESKDGGKHAHTNGTVGTNTVAGKYYKNSNL